MIASTLTAVEAARAGPGGRRGQDSCHGRADRHRRARRGDHLREAAPLPALILGSRAVGAIAGRNMLDVVGSFSTGVGDTVKGVGV